MKNKSKQNILTLFICFFTLALSAQRIQFETIEITSPYLFKTSNELKFNQKTNLLFKVHLKLKGSETEVPFVTIALSGSDKKGKKYHVAVDVQEMYKTERIRGNVVIDASEDNEIFINEITISATDSKKNTITETQEIFSRVETNFAILLNGVRKDICENPDLNYLYMNQNSGENYETVAFALRKTNKSEFDLYNALKNNLGVGHGHYVWTTSHDQRIQKIVKPTFDENGNYIFKDSVFIGKETPVLTSFKIVYVNACGDTLVYNSQFKEKLAAEKKWDYKVRMLFFGSEGNRVQQTRHLRIGGNSNLSISGGNLEIRDNSQFKIGFGDLNVSNGKLKMKNEKLDAFVSITGSILKGGDETFRYLAKWNESTEMYEVTASVKGSEKEPFILKEYLVEIVNLKGDTVVFENKDKIFSTLSGDEIIIPLAKIEKIKNPTCEEKYNIKEINFIESTLGDLYTLQVNFKLENQINPPTKIDMIVEVNDCVGNSHFMVIKLIYNSKTNSYYGSEVLTQPKNCQFELIYGEIATLNQCNEKKVWSFETSKAKSNGFGTRNVATTTSGKPKLL